MSWDPALLRKYSSTGHFRLLNQLKGDLSKRGLDRDRSTGALRMPGNGGRVARRSQTSRRPSVSPTETAVTITPASQVTVAEARESAGTFRQRLSAIEMR